jgi:hypothetical protein
MFYFDELAISPAFVSVGADSGLASLVCWGDEVRSGEGFNQEPELSELLTAEDPAPIMLISASMWRSDALVVRIKSVTVVPLPQLHQHDAVNHAGMLDNAKGAGGHASALPFILGWLWDVAAHPILEEFGYPTRSDQEYNDWHRVCWVPIGVMACLLLHAAG